MNDTSQGALPEDSDDSDNSLRLLIVFGVLTLLLIVGSFFAHSRIHDAAEGDGEFAVALLSVSNELSRCGLLAQSSATEWEQLAIGDDYDGSSPSVSTAAQAQCAKAAEELSLFLDDNPQCESVQDSDSLFPIDESCR